MNKGNIVSLIILGCFIIFFIVQKAIFVDNASYTKGIIEKESVVAKGQHYFDYSFFVSGIKYHGSIPIEFCLDSKAPCTIGDSVIVRYQKNHPARNDLVHSIP
jgi:hypothetical protein